MIIKYGNTRGIDAAVDPIQMKRTATTGQLYEHAELA